MGQSEARGISSRHGRHLELQHGTPDVRDGHDLARPVGVEGYYVRIAPPPDRRTPLRPAGICSDQERAPGSSIAGGGIVSPDALALVRFGLRAPDDPRMLNTVKVIDALLA